MKRRVAQSQAPQAHLAERIDRGDATSGYALDLEGQAGSVDTFRIRAPVAAAKPIVVTVDRGTARVAAARGAWRMLIVAFPATGVDRDGYAAVHLTASIPR